MAQNQPPMRPPAAPPVSYEVGPQQEVTDVGDDGRLTRGYRVPFKTAAGNSGSVFVPAYRYTVENVRAAIRQHANIVDGVQNLKD
jgi:hypothetical protein